jgi:hypothetical protein
MVQPPSTVVEVEVVLDGGDRHLAIGEQDVAVALRADAVGTVEAHEEPRMAGHVVEHPLAHTGGSAGHTRARRTVQARPTAPALVTPRVVAEERGVRSRQRDGICADADPTFTLTGDLVGRSLR